MSKGYYKRLSSQKYACIVCGQVFDGAFALQDAKTCHKSLKPLSEQALRQAEAILNKSIHLDTPRTAGPEDGIKHPDKWQHWHRGKPGTPKQITADVNRAMTWLDKELSASRLDAINHMWSFDADLKEWLTKFHAARSNEQLIAFFYHKRNYQMMKVYIDRLVEEAIRNRQGYILKHPEQYGLKFIDGYIEQKEAAKPTIDLAELASLKPENFKKDGDL